MMTPVQPPHDSTRTEAPCGWSHALLAGFRAGEPQALREVYRMHVRDITGLLRHGFGFTAAGRSHRFVGLQQAFELHDALHETFVRAFEPAARQGFDGIRPYGPYLRTIARNVVLRSFRKHREMFPVQDDAGHDEGLGVVLESDAPSPEQSALERELQAVVREFLAQVGADDRALLQARFVDGLSQRDAADALGLGRQQVRAREARLREALLVWLRSKDGGQPFELLGALPVTLAGLLAEALR
ncbi:MAG: sigma-70 family RNA polymerase sigma factor [Deltaproteobacteria bacterium]|nr:sigma-70 family RNA polymerase sigma factor [Deltaproteobacteria bacterium]